MTEEVEAEVGQKSKRRRQTFRRFSRNHIMNLPLKALKKGLVSEKLEKGLVSALFALKRPNIGQGWCALERSCVRIGRNLSLARIQKTSA